MDMSDILLRDGENHRLAACATEGDLQERLCFELERIVP